MNPAGIRRVYERWETPEAQALQAAITALRCAFDDYAPIPALKAVAAALYGSPEWRTVRPPLRPLSDRDGAQLMAVLGRLGFQTAEFVAP